MKHAAAPPRPPVDWTALRRRLVDAEQRLAQGFAPPPEQQRAILRARALGLAAEATAAPGESSEVLEFVLAQERYAIETAWVREVVPLRDLTPLPGLPAFVLGIIHLRGQIVSLLDLRKFFELPE
jgi:purine-binding chemotaxis protein CheW